MRSTFTILTICLLLAASCGKPSEPAEVLIVVDTNLPVPRVVSSMHFDFYKSDGTWFDSRTEDQLTADRFPLSFTLAGDQMQRANVMVRIRAFKRGSLRPYTGEQYRAWPDVVTSTTTGNGQPRLIKDGVDLTPAAEPMPELTVDRLVNVTIAPNQRGKVVVVLDGSCVGRMAELAPAWASCHSATELHVHEEAVKLDADMTLPTTSMVGSVGQSPCPPEPKSHDAPCIPGGAFILGPSPFSTTQSLAQGRVVIVPTLRVSKTEVTVAQMRRAVKDDGFRAQGVMTGVTPMPTDPIYACTLTGDPGSREGFAVSCVGWVAASAYCNFYGGDLPGEAEWEYVATSSGRDEKTLYPWGDTPPSCNDAIYGRAPIGDIPGDCLASGAGPIAIYDEVGTPLPTHDTTTQGILGLAGSLSEWTRDAALPWDDPCWLNAPTVSPFCPIEGAQKIGVRGGAWAAPLVSLVASTRVSAPQDAINGVVGFRCVFH